MPSHASQMPQSLITVGLADDYFATSDGCRSCFHLTTQTKRSDCPGIIDAFDLILLLGFAWRC